jgi:DNA-binding GntR family transcriptional regulator
VIFIPLVHLVEANMDLIRKKSLKDEVFELLHNRIITGEYSSGEWLRQEEISTQLGVSQTPVREALDRLVSEGLAERTPKDSIPWRPHSGIFGRSDCRCLCG